MVFDAAFNDDCSTSSASPFWVSLNAKLCTVISPYISNIEVILFVEVRRNYTERTLDLTQ